MKQRLITFALLIAIALLSIKLIQQFRALHTPVRHLVFTCAVAVQDQVGQVCIEGDLGAWVHATITYCTHESVNSPEMASQVPGTNEYRWIWQVHQPTSCTGKRADAQASALWADGSQAKAEATFPVALPAQFSVPPNN